MKRLLVFIFLIASYFSAQSQIFTPVKWSFAAEHISDNDYILRYTATIDKGWNVYSQFTSDDGPVPTSINYEEMDGIELIGNAKEYGARKEGKDPLFDNVVVIKFLADKPFVIEQNIRVKDASRPLTGYLTYMSCDDEKCLPPTDEDFSFNLSAIKKAGTTATDNPIEENIPAQENYPFASDETDDAELSVTETDSIFLTEITAGAIGAIINGDRIDQKIETLAHSYEKPLSDCGGTEEKKEGLFWTFLFGILGGFIALLTPCVFPMLPITVSFFTKDKKRKGWMNGLIYGISIIVIYVSAGLLITALLGPEALNRLSTNWIANTLFFLIFIAFAFSFFGFYEITLPSSWSTKSDKMADKGGLIGVFFMAFTLVLVSFSCTGPIIGTAIVQAATKGEYLGPFLVMLGFSIGLALPFGLFAAFPAWLNSLPKSGSWMNSVKVVLGFLELALALKFLSIADMTNGWGMLKYELFMVLWILIFIGTALYLFGFIKFPLDSPLKKLSKTRLGFGIFFSLLVVYLISGLTINKSTGDYNAKLLMSGLAPPAHYNFFLKPGDLDTDIKTKYPSYSKCANNINCFKDYFEGMSYANEVNRPVLIDFSGYGCVNCRKTEEHIWVDDKIRTLLNDSIVLISLYVDDDTKLDEIFISEHSNKKLRNIGNKWADFQIVNFQQNSQPLYVMTTTGQEVITKPRPFIDSVDGYLDFLRCSIEQGRKYMSKNQDDHQG